MLRLMLVVVFFCFRYVNALRPVPSLFEVVRSSSNDSKTKNTSNDRSRNHSCLVLFLLRWWRWGWGRWRRSCGRFCRGGCGTNFLGGEFSRPLDSLEPFRPDTKICLIGSLIFFVEDFLE